MNIVISSLTSGATGILDAADEARKVVDAVADALLKRGAGVVTACDDLETTLALHNDQARDLDVQVAFNSYTETDKPMGVEVLYVSAADIAAHVSNAIAK